MTTAWKCPVCRFKFAAKQIRGEPHVSFNGKYWVNLNDLLKFTCPNQKAHPKRWNDIGTYAMDWFEASQARQELQ